jgi:hypothetical protein
MKSAYQKATCRPTFIAAPLSGWIDEEIVAYKHNEVLFSYRQEWNPAISSKTDGTGEHCAKWGKPDTEEHVLLHMWKQKHQSKRGIVITNIGKGSRGRLH